MGCGDYLKSIKTLKRKKKMQVGEGEELTTGHAVTSGRANI